MIIPGQLRIVFPLLIMILIYGVSSIPGVPLQDDPAHYHLFSWVPPSIQNALHVPAYAALAAAWRWALEVWSRTQGSAALSACAITSTYGILDEWHQSFVPGRYASLTDVTLNVAGAVIGIWIAARVTSRSNPEKP